MSSDEELEAAAEKVTSKLSTAQPAAIARERSLLLNRGERKRRRCGPSTKLRKKSLHECVAEFADEKLTVERGAIFCSACRAQVSEKSSSLKRHVSSTRHQQGKKALEAHKMKQQSIAVAMKRVSDDIHVKGETLPEKELVFRCEVVQTFLRAGVPLSKVQHFRQLLERVGSRLADRSVLSRQCLPAILRAERSNVQQAIAGRPVAVIFDGSTRLGEVLAVILRFSDDEWSPKQVLVRFKALSKSLTGEQLAGELIDVLATQLQVQRSHVIAAVRDGAAVNGCALRVVKALYPKLLEVTCFSHTIDLVGSHFEVPTLDQFIQWWIQLFSRSAAAKLRWKERTGVAMRSYSATRWWSKWEVINQVLTHFGDIEPFLQENQDIAPRLGDHLRVLLEDQERRKLLIMEIAAIIDAGEPFVKATYVLEGDGLLVFSAYATLQSLSTAAAQRHYPNVTAQARTLAASAQEEAALQQHARACVQPGVDYFLQKFNLQFYDVVRAFKAARYACPVRIQELQPTPAELDVLRAFPFLDDDETIADLQRELPLYRAEAEGVRLEDGQQMAWFRNHSGRLPHWSKAARLISLVQPSSAAAERVFSLLQANFNDKQLSTLGDELEASLMLGYNHRGE